jgi:hypothetical protein
LRRKRLFGIHRIDDDAGDAMPVERDCQSEADKPAAEDDYVRSLHFPDLAMHGCNAKRLTGDSGKAHCGKWEHMGHG